MASAALKAAHEVAGKQMTNVFLSMTTFPKKHRKENQKENNENVKRMTRLECKSNIIRLKTYASRGEPQEAPG
jgi:hypothetical protein